MILFSQPCESVNTAELRWLACRRSKLADRLSKLLANLGLLGQLKLVPSGISSIVDLIECNRGTEDQD